MFTQSGTLQGTGEQEEKTGYKTEWLDLYLFVLVAVIIKSSNLFVICCGAVYIG